VVLRARVQELPLRIEYASLTHCKVQVETGIRALVYDEGGTVEPAVGGYALVVLQQVTHYPDIHFQSELVGDLPLVRIELDPLQHSRCLGIVV